MLHSCFLLFLRGNVSILDSFFHNFLLTPVLLFLSKAINENNNNYDNALSLEKKAKCLNYTGIMYLMTVGLFILCLGATVGIVMPMMPQQVEHLFSFVSGGTKWSLLVHIMDTLPTP